jgi:hypothetical protein
MALKNSRKLSAEEIAYARLQAKEPHRPIARLGAAMKIPVEVGTLRAMLRIIDATSPFGVTQRSSGETEAFQGRTRSQRHQALRNLAAFTAEHDL